ncbi:MAG: hypothetical protein IPK94_20930 [Saprospiraceae bacterium]|nr:hypothetical protein [Saprospiraceae bacterium]
MSLWDKIFSKKEEVKDVEGIKAYFGRFTDAYKSTEQYEAWDKAVLHFENRDFQDAIAEFINYIRDTSEHNVSKLASGALDFDILQGSKTIMVRTKNGQIRVNCKIAHADQLHIGFMRRLLDLNYELKYVRYGLSEDEVIQLLFDTALEDASPYKLYFALKELAIHADKQDDLLVDEFSFLKPIRSGQIESLPVAEVKLKTDFFYSSINKALQIVDQGKLKIEQYPAAGGYILLALLYKLDYLVRPEGSMMDRIEQIHKSYFSQDNKNQLHKLKSLRQDLSLMGQQNEETLKRDLHHSIFTFGVTSPGNTAMVMEVLDREINNIQWYLDNHHHEYAIAIVEYAVGICLFNFALPDPIKDLFTLVYRVTEPAFFDSIDNYEKLALPSGLPDKSAIKSALHRIEKMHQKVYPGFALDARQLDYSQVSYFVHSLILQVRKIQMQKSK